MMKAGTINATRTIPEFAPRKKFDCSGSTGAAAATASHPPASDRASGSPIANPPSKTHSCTRFTHADVSRPPEAK